MSDWRFACERAVQRAGHDDQGAVAAREGILGLPLTVQGKTALRVYKAASDARKARNEALASRGKQIIKMGSTGFGDLDQKLHVHQLATA